MKSNEIWITDEKQKKNYGFENLVSPKYLDLKSSFISTHYVLNFYENLETENLNGSLMWYGSPSRLNTLRKNEWLCETKNFKRNLHNEIINKNRQTRAPTVVPKHNMLLNWTEVFSQNSRFLNFEDKYQSPQKLDFKGLKER